MAFTYDLATNVGKVRFKLTDTREASAWFSDAEIDEALSDAGGVNPAVVYLARVLMMDRARRSYAWKNTEGAFNDAAQIQALKDLIAQYGGTGDNLPSVTISFPALLPMDAGFDESDP